MAKGNSVFETLIQRLDRKLEIDEEELSMPVTIDVRGDVVTMKDLMFLDESPTRPARVGHPPRRRRREAAALRAIDDLNPEEIRRLAIETVRAVPQDLALGSIGRGSVSIGDMEREIEQRTVIGERFVEAVRDHSIFLQEAFQAGKVSVRPGRKSSGTVELPKFDF